MAKQCSPKKELLKSYRALISHCVAKKIAYKMVTDQELQKLTDSIHHEGICLIVKHKMILDFDTWFERFKSKRSAQTFVYLNRVGNPHNIGNILRTSAHFGSRVLFVDDSFAKTVPAVTQKISEGGSEFVEIVRMTNPIENLKTLQENRFKVVATTSYTLKSAFQMSVPNKLVIVLGNEQNGIEEEILDLANEKVCLGGTEQVESINIASAHAIMLSLVQK